MMFRFRVLDWQLLPRLAAGLQAAEMLGDLGGGGTCFVSNTVTAHVPRRKAFSLSCWSIQQLQGLQGKS